MNEENIKDIIRDFAKSGEDEYQKSFKVRGKSRYIFNIKIERQEIRNIEEGAVYDSIATESYISAYPSGSPCPSCNGSGKI